MTQHPMGRTRRCVPPIRWVQSWLVPPEGDPDWQRVSFQPMLYLATWIGGLVVLFTGDFASQPIEHADRVSGVFWIWGGLSLICPPAALLSLWLIQHNIGSWRYLGLWLRFGADMGQFTAMSTYCVVRIQAGDFHVLPVAVLFGATLFVLHLVMRDVHRLVEVERLATRLHRHGNFGQ